VACTFPTQTVECGASFCQNGIESGAPLCNGAGTCRAPSTRDCFPTVCDDTTTTCLSECLGDADCFVGFVCDAGECVPEQTPVQDAGADSGIEAGLVDAGVVEAGTGGAASVGDGGGGSPVANPDGGMVMTGGSAGVSDAGADSGFIDAIDRGSCGCRVPGSQGSSSPASWLVALGLGLLAMRRRGAATRLRAP
jgi:MYXO-CTERM domain-containing protein